MAQGEVKFSVKDIIAKIKAAHQDSGRQSLREVLDRMKARTATGTIPEPEARVA